MLLWLLRVLLLLGNADENFVMLNVTLTADILIHFTILVGTTQAYSELGFLFNVLADDNDTRGFSTFFFSYRHSLRCGGESQTHTQMHRDLEGVKIRLDVQQ